MGVCVSGEGGAIIRVDLDNTFPVKKTNKFVLNNAHTKTSPKFEKLQPVVFSQPNAFFWGGGGGRGDTMYDVVCVTDH